ncbi:MAG TPA: alpha-L-rhamnosidase C-terminal domain-containing protein [Actinophytocola sp.]|uniref:alpha-L-rhamnosidase C-terminal domain-containing protein n=1 Tax=Actinophytocola sp. TaxID=1872138 RepID=UPI002DB5D596|nr:alpha-L-rhamnosidase C-terminal domain-containing protein [Actinophytocola sp.]HEU5469856.1 alpha-L-rhamnosidase C-terminal domain-containing protein [Actinophytocola sp.]
MPNSSGFSAYPARTKRRWKTLRMVTAMAVTAVVAVAAPATATATAAELPTWPANPDWQRLVPAPTSNAVRPVGVVRTHGSVTNPGALTGQSSGSAVLTVPSGGAPAIVVLDFGKEVGGNPFLTVSAASAASTTVRVATSEALPFLTRATNGLYNNDNGSVVTFSVTGPRTYTGGLRGGFRFAAIQLTSPGTLTLSAAGVNFAAYRATPDRYQGYFISSDDQLNRIWYAGAYTAQLDMVPAGVAPCFRAPVIFDGAKRDRAIWSGDLMITDPVALLSIGTNGVPYIKGSIDSIMNLQSASGRLTSAVGFRGCGAFDYAVTYSAYSAIIAIQYYRYTGDTAYLTALRPRLEAATAFHATRLNANGLVVTGDPDYWQTRQNGEVTEYSLAYYELLQNMIWLETRIGTPARVTEYTTKAAALKTAINARLFNTTAGLYVHTDTRRTVFPLDANVNAIRLGVAPAERVAGILAYFRDRWQAHGSQISQPAPSMADPGGHTIEPLNNTWEVMARFHSNDTGGALELIRRHWGIQVDPNSGYYTGTFWEFVGSNGLPTRGFDSLAHAWGAGPTQLLTESVLGATPVDPGYTTWQVKPQPATLAWAQGQVPTPRGPLAVRWAQDTAGQFHLQVVSPAGTGGEVWVPLASTAGTSTALTAGATFLRRTGNYDVYRVGAGTFEFSSAP